MRMKCMLACLLAALLVAVGCTPAKGPPKAEVPAEYRSLRMVGASLGSAGATAVMALASVFNKYIPEIAWSSSSGSTGTNAIYLTKGTIKLGQTAAVNYLDAYGFDKISESRLRSITPIFAPIHNLFLIPEDKPWKDITEVPKGSTLSGGSPGGNVAIISEGWVRLAGLSKKDFNWVNTSMAEMADAWRAGKLDVVFIGVAGMSPALMDMYSSPRRFKPMGLSPEQAARARAEQTFERLGADPPAKGFLTQIVPEVFKQDVESVQVTPFLSSRDDFPEGIGFNIAKVMDEHSIELIQVYAALKWATPQSHIKWARPPLDVHPGVAKYYKEKGYLK